MARKERTPTDDDGEDWFDYWLMAEGSLARVAAEIADVINENRERRRIQSHRRAVFETTVSAVVANLAHAAENTESGWIAVQFLTDRSAGLGRYRCPMVPVRMLKGVLAAGVQNGFLELRTGRRGVSSTIRPTDTFRDHLRLHQAHAADAVRFDGEELIIVSEKLKHQFIGKDGKLKRIETNRRAPYTDTEDTNLMRVEIEELNAHLATADLSFIDDGELPRVHTDKRRLQRHFSLLPEENGTPSFQFGGRLFGAFWLNLKKERRRAGLRIDGEPIAEVDFNAMFTRIAYAEQGKAVGANDDPYTPVAMELDEERGAVKQAVNALFFTRGMTSWPYEIAVEWKHSPSVAVVRNCILKHLPRLEPYLGTIRGYGFMRTESEIMLACLNALRAKGITALPLHDAVLAPLSKADDVRQVLEDTAKRITGVWLPVGVKRPE